MKRILVLHGPNLDLLGTRQPEVYGALTLEQINQQLQQLAGELSATLTFFQSAIEGELVARIGTARETFDGLLLNPAAYTHTSVALHDALRACGRPCIEVHLSNTHAREEFRHRSLTAPACIGQIMGLGLNSYLLALRGLLDHLNASTGSAKG